jgi:hypothetical protein
MFNALDLPASSAAGFEVESAHESDSPGRAEKKATFGEATQGKLFWAHYSSHRGLALQTDF